MRASAARISGVSKSFGGHLAVDRLSLDVPAGGIYGLIGPNGSGKTTTLRMVMNLILPDQGHIEVLGMRGAEAARDRVTYLPEERGLYKRMTVRQLLRYYGVLKGAPLGQLDLTLPRWLDRLGLLSWAESRVESLSKGMQQKVQFLAALVSEPDLIILDEPFSGLDPAGVRDMKAILLDLRTQGRTIIFSTHLMASAEELCDRIGMVFKGRLVLDGSLSQIRRANPRRSVRIRAGLGLKAVQALPGVVSARKDQDSLCLALAGDPQAFLRSLLRKTRVLSFEVERATLNDIFLAHLQVGELSHASR